MISNQVCQSTRCLNNVHEFNFESGDVMKPLKQHSLIWAVALLLTIVSFFIISTLSKSAEQVVERFTLLLLQPIIALLFNRFDLPVFFLKLVLYVQFPTYATILSCSIPRNRFVQVLKLIIGFHLLLVIGAAFVVIRYSS